MLQSHLFNYTGATLPFIHLHEEELRGEGDQIKHTDSNRECWETVCNFEQKSAIISPVGAPISPPEIRLDLKYAVNTLQPNWTGY